MGTGRIKFCLVVISALAMASALLGCSPMLYKSDQSDISSQGVTGQTQKKNIIGTIMPHHLLVQGEITKLYASLANKKIEHVIIISPNHFGYGFSYMQSADSIEDSDARLNTNFIHALAEKGMVSVEPRYFPKEFGIMPHIGFAKTAFPDADIVPIIVKKNCPQEKLDRLADFIAHNVEDNTLIVASIDFTHYEPEEFALKDDQRTIQWLENWNEEGLSSSDYDAIHALAVATYDEKINIPNEHPVAMDSPETLYTMTRIFSPLSKDFRFIKRTSSASIFDSGSPENNTSHIFALFE